METPITFTEYFLKNKRVVTVTSAIFNITGEPKLNYVASKLDSVELLVDGQSVMTLRLNNLMLVMPDALLGGYTFMLKSGVDVNIR